MKILATTLTIVALTLAGCVSGNDPSGDPSTSSDPTVGLPARSVPWGLQDCAFGAAMVPADPALLKPYLPEGFRSLSLNEIGFGGAPNPGNEGNFGVELFECAAGTGLNGTLGAVSYGSYFTAVEPPAKYRRDVGLHFVKWDVVIPDAALRGLLQSYGIPAVDGKATFSFQNDGAGSVSVLRGTLEMNGTAVADISGTTSVPEADGSFIEYTVTPGGLANWTVSYSLSAGGVGPHSVTAKAGSFAAEIIGTEAVAGVGFGGRVTFGPAVINLPAQPA